MMKIGKMKEIFLFQLIMSSPEIINFMAKFGRGLICLTLTEEKARQLNLPLMVQENEAKLGTNFTVSIEA